MIEPLLPSSDGQRGRPFRDHRHVVEGIVYRYRAGLPWRDAPASFRPWQTVWKRHRRLSADGAWDRILTHLLVPADAAEELDRDMSVDSTINRAHQHAASMSWQAMAEQPGRTGGPVELHESRPARR